ncbi:MAG: elongation factor 1-beta [Methanomicrobiales archaeon]|nr:elongation factor 1-beta [Methanomicrobiales archaeon]
MGSVVAILRVMPESIDVDLGKLTVTIRKTIPAVQDIAEEPIAFGLKALKVAAIVGDDEGGTEPLEKAIAAIKGVASAETIDLNRMI